MLQHEYGSRPSLTHRTLSAKRKRGKNLPTSLALFEFAPQVLAGRAKVTRSVSEGTGRDRVRPSLTLRGREEIKSTRLLAQDAGCAQRTLRLLHSLFGWRCPFAGDKRRAQLHDLRFALCVV